MKLRKRRRLCLCAAMLAIVPYTVAATATSSEKDAGNVAVQKAAEEFGKLPLAFEPNRGQTDARVDYLSQGRGYTLFLTPSGATFTLRRSDAKGADVLRMDLAGANVRPAVSAEELLPGRVNYLRGSDPAKWKTGIEEFAKVRYHDVYPGVDLVYYGNQGHLEYDFVVNPGAQAANIAFVMPDAQTLRRTEQGELLIQLANGDVRWKQPEAYQVAADGRRQKVEAEYAVVGKAVGFRIGSYDRTLPLVIDPMLVFGTYLGVADQSVAEAIVLDQSHNIYIAGSADSSQYPTTPNAFQKTEQGPSAAFVTKLTPDGKTLIYSTFIGGSQSDSAYALAVDSAGNAYISGDTISTDYPVTPGAYHLYGGEGYATAFITKLDSTGSSLLYSAELGAATARSIVVDSAGNAYATGGVFGPAFMTTPGAYKRMVGSSQCYNVSGESYVFKMNPAGNAPVYSTYISDCEQAYGIALKNGNVYITGQTDQYHPVTPGVVQPKFGGYIDSFVTEVNTSGSALVYSTYLGGTLGDNAAAIALDANGDAVVVGATASVNFPVVNAFQSKIPSQNDHGFVSKLNPTATAFVYSTYLGGSNYDFVRAVALDSSGNTFVTGPNASSDFPLKNSFQGICGQSSFNICWSNAFVTEFSPSGALIASTLYGPSTDWDDAWGIATDSQGNAYIAGFAGMNLPTLNAYEATTNGDEGTVFLAKINMTGQTGCTNLRQDRSVAVCTPFTGATSGPFVRVSAVVNDSNTVNAIQVYVDGTFVFEEDTGKQIDSWVQMSPGTHSIAVKAWDKNGSFLSTRSVTVAGTNTASCAVGEIEPYVQICTPVAASSVSNPVQVHAVAASQNPPVTAMTLYIDHNVYKTVNTSTLDWSGSLGAGWHNLTVNGWDWQGQVFKQTVWVYVK